jgi:hypothetical protein
MGNQATPPDEMMRHEASFAMDRLKKAILDGDMHSAVIYLEQAVSFANSALAFARQASIEAMVERPPKAAKPRPNLTLVHSKE